VELYTELFYAIIAQAGCIGTTYVLKYHISCMHACEHYKKILTKFRLLEL